MDSWFVVALAFGGGFGLGWFLCERQYAVMLLDLLAEKNDFDDER